MKNNDIYYTQIEQLIKRNEINKQARYYKDTDTLVTYQNVGRLLAEAQKNEHPKYGDNYIKEWSNKLTLLYGKGYDATNMRKFRQFFLMFPNRAPVERRLSWSHYKTLLPIKDENKRNYYINLCITNNLSKNELINSIKNNPYERLLNKPKNIEIINDKNRTYEIKEHIKNPIILKLNKFDEILNEHDLQIKILAELKNFFQELGEGYTFVGNEYKISYGSRNYYLDILLFNYKLNAFIVVELKMRELKKEDKAQMEFYMNLVDTNLKEDFHNETIGIIVTRFQKDFIVSFVSQDKIIPITYKLDGINSKIEI